MNIPLADHFWLLPVKKGEARSGWSTICTLDVHSRPRQPLLDIRLNANIIAKHQNALTGTSRREAPDRENGPQIESLFQGKTPKTTREREAER